MPYKLSPSALSLLSECPKCFWLHHNKGICRPEGIFPSLPNGIDKILKIHFDAYMKKGELPPELHKLNNHVKLFDNFSMLEQWRNARQGLVWKDAKGNILKGALDNLLQKGDKLIVIDYKTRGYPINDKSHTYYQDQMNIYNL